MASSKDIMRKILRDVRVEASQQFDRNFTQESFFGTPWPRRKGPVRRNRHLLVSTGDLRRSILSRSDENSITFYSDLPYAAIQNKGGDIRVTARMKRLFWAKYYEATGGFKRRKDGSLSRSKRQVQLSEEAEFWKAMALKKVGETVTIPKRQYLGTSPQLENAVKAIIEKDIEEYLKTIKDEIKP